MAVYTDITTFIQKLNAGEKCCNFSSMEIGTCFTIKMHDLHANKILIKLRGETIEKNFFFTYTIGETYNNRNI